MRNNKSMPILANKEAMIKYICTNWAKETVNKFESVYVGYVDEDRRLIKWELFNTGTYDSCAIDVKRLMRTAVLNNAHGIILAHNHPDGRTEPSDVDLGTTEYIYQQCCVLGIELIDHVIVSSGEGPHSFNSAGLIKRFKENNILEKGSFASLACGIVREYCETLSSGRKSEYSVNEAVTNKLRKIYIKFFDPII